MKYGLIVLMGLFSGATYAEQQDVINELKARLKGLETFEAVFSQTVVDGQGELLQESTGRILLKQPNQMRWEVAEPDENLLIADGQSLWHVDPFVEQVVAMDQQDAVNNNPVILLSNPDSELWADFDISSESQNFVVRAKSDQAQIVALTLTFEGETLTALSFEDSQEQKSALTFSGIQQNHSLADTEFEFSLPEGFDLDDQRTP